MHNDLKHTVETHSNILEVHFDTEGHHYFNVRYVDGVGYGQFLNGFPIISSRIVETITREEVLGKSRNFDTQDKKEYNEAAIEVEKSKKSKKAN